MNVHISTFCLTSLESACHHYVLSMLPHYELWMPTSRGFSQSATDTVTFLQMRILHVVRKKSDLEYGHVSHGQSWPGWHHDRCWINFLRDCICIHKVDLVFALVVIFKNWITKHYYYLFGTSALDPETKMGGEACTCSSSLSLLIWIFCIAALQNPYGFHNTLWSLWVPT